MLELRFLNFERPVRSDEWPLLTQSGHKPFEERLTNRRQKSSHYGLMFSVSRQARRSHECAISPLVLFADPAPQNERPGSKQNLMLKISDLFRRHHAFGFDPSRDSMDKNWQQRAPASGADMLLQLHACRKIVL
jgi:hypothetical protein